MNEVPFIKISLTIKGKVKIMLQEKTGNIAGLIWNALAAAEEAQTFKQIKKATKLAEKLSLIHI